METCLLHLHHRSGFIPFPPTHRRPPRPLPIAVKMKPFTAAAKTESTIAGACGRTPPPDKPDTGVTPPPEKKAKHRDSWFDLLAINYMTSSLRAASGRKKRKMERGYEGLVAAAAMIASRHGAMEQQNIVIEALDNAFPPAIFSMIRSLLAPSKLSRELFARFTTMFFSWLVGHCEVRDTEVHGKREKNVVYIQKCRFLEATNCAGMCINLCKLPSQKFIGTRLGMPTTMLPNFEDQSCEIIFGQIPPADDQALKQPCYQTSCIAKQTQGVDCSS